MRERTQCIPLGASRSRGSNPAVQPRSCTAADWAVSRERGDYEGFDVVIMSKTSGLPVDLGAGAVRYEGCAKMSLSLKDLPSFLRKPWQ
jgi:hypothetical protein